MPIVTFSENDDDDDDDDDNELRDAFRFGLLQLRCDMHARCVPFRKYSLYYRASISLLDIIALISCE